MQHGFKDYCTTCLLPFVDLMLIYCIMCCSERCFSHFVSRSVIFSLTLMKWQNIFSEVEGSRCFHYFIHTSLLRHGVLPLSHTSWLLSTDTIFPLPPIILQEGTPTGFSWSSPVSPKLPLFLLLHKSSQMLPPFHQSQRFVSLNSFVLNELVISMQQCVIKSNDANASSISVLHTP